MRKLFIILSVFTFFLACKKEDTNDFPLDGNICYLKSFGTTIYAIENSGFLAQGGKTFQIKFKKATQANTYYIVSNSDESKVFEHTDASDVSIKFNTVSTPENNNQVFSVNKVSNVDAYTIIPQNALAKKLAVDLPPTLTFALFLIDINSTDVDFESRFVLEK